MRNASDYALLDSGYGEKWERFGPVTLIRPCPHAIWRPSHSRAQWEQANGIFTRKGRWEFPSLFTQPWEIYEAGVALSLHCTDFGHLGFFPEHAAFWERIRRAKAPKVLNLFAYSGGSSLAAAQGGAEVTHVDAAAGAISWAKENAQRNQCSIRWIVEDAMKFVKRAVRRGERYQGILLDPPTFGRGRAGEVFRIEEDLLPLLELCAQIWDGQYLLLTCHTPGYTPLVLQQVAAPLWPSYSMELGELFLEGPQKIPSGSYLWISKDIS